VWRSRERGKAQGEGALLNCEQREAANLNTAAILERNKKPPAWRLALTTHWPEYLIEAAALGLFMLSASAFVALLEHPASPVRQALADPTLRRFLIGLAMGLTAIAIIYSPWGKRSGAHINPAVTLTFARLHKIERWDAVFYIAAQFIGAALGMAIALLTLSSAVVAHPAVNYVETLPGGAGPGAAFLAEAAISCGLMLMVLIVSNKHELNRYTGLLAGALVATYITIEAPISGMSMNPARSFGSALAAQDWQALWIYFTAPPLGMLLAAQLYLHFKGRDGVLCCKLHHENDERCIFRCTYHDT
jgi:aquaporin Z